MKNLCDIVVTWPKARPFGSYMVELARARAQGLVVNFRIHGRPHPRPQRCYRVHDGLVRGFLPVLGIVERGEGEVARVPSDPAGGYWPAGTYVVCEPFWYEAPRKVAMTGFRGWRWFDRALVGDE